MDVTATECRHTHATPRGAIQAHRVRRAALFASVQTARRCRCDKGVASLQRSNGLKISGRTGSQDPSQDQRSSADQDPGPGPDRRSLTIFQIPAAPALRPGRPSGPASAPHANTHQRNTHAHTPVRAGLTSHSPHDQDRRARNQTAGSEKMHGRPDIYTMHTFSSSLCHPSFPRPSSPSYTTSTHPTTLRGCKHGRPRVIPGGEATQQYVVPPRPAGRSKPLKARGTIHADDTRRTRVVSGV